MKPFASDMELIGALKKGEGRAFDVVYNAHVRGLCYFAEGYLKNTQQAEDIVAESFVKLLRSNPDFETPGKLKSWLYTTTRNACLDLLRNEKRHQASHQELGYLAGQPEESDAGIVRAEVLQALHAAIEQLPTQCRRIIRLSYIEGKKIDEIASEMGIAYQTVQNQKQRGIKLLRAALLENPLLSPVLLAACLQWLADHGDRF